MKYWANIVFYLIAAFSGYGVASIFSLELSLYDLPHYGMGITFVIALRSFFLVNVRTKKGFYYFAVFSSFLGVVLSIISASFSIVEGIKNIITPEYYYIIVISVIGSTLLLLMTSIYYLNKT
ncbi:hypothetical protein [Thiolinea disciformis]|uniref:hypothetical protein n=1 Tax=Thiolinea disciformis TaxID=125614 RepID=UPI00037A4C7E|nr:hypothetical protein [Thiolinea disciformis]